MPAPPDGETESGAGSAASRGRPALVAAWLSALIPGAGQFVAGRRDRALAFFVPVALLILAAMVFVLTAGRAELAAVLVQPRWLWGLLIANLALLALRAWSTVDAYRLGRPPSRWRWAGPIGLAVALAFTAAPHLLAATYKLVFIDTLETVFAPPSPTAATNPEWPPEPVPPTAVTFPPPTTSTTEPRPVGVPDFELPPITLPDTEFLPLEEISPGRYLSILLAGGDAGPGRGGLRTDTMIVATFDLETGRTYLFGVSRELVHIPLPREWNDRFEDLEDTLWEWELREWIRKQDQRCRRGSVWKKNPPDFCPAVPEQPERCECFPDRLNAIYTYTRNWGWKWPNAPDPGMEALRQAMETLLKIPIRYYVLVDMAGFVALVDALGGVGIWVNESIHQGFSPAVEGGPIVRVDVDPGWHHLDGNQALAYVRSRDNVGDYGRIRRQRCMLRSVAAAVDPLDLLWRFNSLAAAVRDNTTTNIPLEYLPELVRTTARLSLEDVVTVNLVGTWYYDDKDFRGIPKPHLGNIRWKVRAVLDGRSLGSSEGEVDECGQPPE